MSENTKTKNKGIPELVRKQGNVQAEDVPAEVERLAQMANAGEINYDRAYLEAEFDRVRNPQGGRGSHNRKARVPTTDRRRKRGAAIPASPETPSEAPSELLDESLVDILPAITESLLENILAENRVLRARVAELEEEVRRLQSRR